MHSNVKLPKATKNLKRPTTMAPPNTTILVARPPRIPTMTSLSETVGSNSASTQDRCRSASHFLHGFNVEDIQDVRSIPDPPTPQPRKRRLSTPGNLRSFQDVTNQHELKSVPTKHVTSRRARKSLCHVPSPAVEVAPEPPAKEGPESPLIPSYLDESKQLPSPSSTPICLDVDFDDDGQEHRTTSRRRRKRQSMVVPTELVVKPLEEETAATMKPSAFEGTMQDLKELQRLVRGYCSLPLEKRDFSEQALKIKETTGYTLHNNFNKDGTGSSLDHAGRRLIYQKISPVIEEMEQRKLEDTHMWEQKTGCRVEKSRSGKFKYVAMETEKKISSKIYMKRYMAVLRANAPARLARANQWKSKLLDETAESPKEDKEASTTSVAFHKNTSDDGNHESPSNDALDLALVALDQQAQDEDSAPEEGEPSMELCDLSVSLDMGDVTNIACSLEEKNMLSASTSTTGETAEETAPDMSPETVIMPSRDHSSKDPDIARAEQVLWRRIDKALEDYSQEVLGIMRERKRQKTSRPSDTIIDLK
eukprot:scaffold11809_cov128-Cylindrotheca_fusiformis.AAC.5